MGVEADPSILQLTLVLYEVVVKVGCPVLALYGGKDIQVPAEGNADAVERALGRGGNSDYRVETVPDLNHIFQTARTGLPDEYGKIEETFSPVALDIITEWILERTP